MSFPSRPEGKADVRRLGALRAALLGAVAVVAVGSAVGVSGLATIPGAQAQAPVAAPLVAMPSFADVIEHVRGAVVSVQVKVVEPADIAGNDDDRPRRGRRFGDQRGGGQGGGYPDADQGDPMERFFRRFGEGQIPRAPQRRGMAQGSGFIISADGYVVTNNHVVKNAVEVVLTLDTGEKLEARVVGTDEKTDLALLKIKKEGTYKFVNFADKAPRVGDWVVAIGNPFGLGGTVTAGIVSARGRDIGSGPYDDFLQIDAPVNRGNSGGPTFDLSGAVVGVNTAIYSPSGGSVGIGFAIPSSTARSVIASLRESGKVTRGYIGVQIQPITKEIADSLGLKNAEGALIAEAQPGTPAANAGLRAGDVIVAVDGEKVVGPRELSRKIASTGPGKEVKITYLRDGSEKNAALKLGVLPGEQRAGLNSGDRNDSSNGGMGPGQERNNAVAALSRFGLSLAPSRDGDGVMVSGLEPDGAAARQGLREGDIILDVGGKPVTRPADVAGALQAASRDGRRAVLVRVRTEGQMRFIALPTQRDAG